MCIVTMVMASVDRYASSDVSLACTYHMVSMLPRFSDATLKFGNFKKLLIELWLLLGAVTIMSMNTLKWCQLPEQD